MTRLLTALTIATCALSAHCSDSDPEWENEGRIYTRADVSVKRVDASLADKGFPVVEGDAVYQVTLEFAPGTVEPGGRSVYPYVLMPPGETLAAGDEPVGCFDTRNADGSATVQCSALSTGEGANRIDVRAGEEDSYFDALPSLNRQTDRVVFEVRRPAAAPSLEGKVWRVIVADQTCGLALKNLQLFPACPEGAECSRAGIEYQVEATGCRWRNE
jgi:hypothetical protein